MVSVAERAMERKPGGSGFAAGMRMIYSAAYTPQVSLTQLAGAKRLNQVEQRNHADECAFEFSGKLR
jgi:hypothetical protein